MPSQGKSTRKSPDIDNVESVVVWSSASTVTQAPTRSARSQMARALSSAIFWPSRSRACPSADSLSDTSSGRTPSHAISPRRPSTSKSPRYARTAAAASSASVTFSPR
ncbi:Uncharacterised protein [Mycobacterium tuberculosis]|uniref:Uncharacterized protein n=1 Tax=Mycobacterium tuberculosis TaxID=1773 RepID=A0A654U7X3_MYCTX|nr:Uncharacterised protein [Mycobacterium tuberculosis]CFS05895.1 Uncharacterised protein [Mycobacterium tuberculosis]CKR97652.1 Uncharacterised protein [Mycobacterium tuberculosis]CKU45555.1 Uncharacterised protein [Mycobacterium tuberculosis]CNV92451.1 Uncharacterised protein [Mycobacterium tuberculosis]